MPDMKRSARLKTRGTDRLPIRDWDLDTVDPAIGLVAEMQRNAALAAMLRRALAVERLPSLDVAELLWLWQERDDAIGIANVARQLHRSRPTASRLVDRAERAGLLQRRPGVVDGRKVSVQPTMRGRAAIHRLDAILRTIAAPSGGRSTIDQ
jgi:DNA-binding MarR family transcriptional regulator